MQLEPEGIIIPWINSLVVWNNGKVGFSLWVEVGLCKTPETDFNTGRQRLLEFCGGADVAIAISLQAFKYCTWDCFST